MLLFDNMTMDHRRDSLLESDDLHDITLTPTVAAKGNVGKSIPHEFGDASLGNNDPSMRYVTILNDSDIQKPNQVDKADAHPTQPTTIPYDPQITILCNHSTHPITLSKHLLTSNSRLFATLSHDASTFTTAGTLQLNIDHDAFTVFARWLRGGPIHVPEGDENGFATDLYMLMRAHAAGEALGAGTFADMVVDEIIAELTDGEREDGGSLSPLRSPARDSRAKARDPEILLQAAAAIWPPGSLGRDLLVDWYVHSPACSLHNLSAEAVVEIGDLDFAARCMVLGKERQMAHELGGDGVVEAPYLVDPCRYHEHRRRGLPCYRRSRDSVFSKLEYIVRCGLGECEDFEDDEIQMDRAMLWEYEACVDESMMLFSNDDSSSDGY